MTFVFALMLVASVLGLTTPTPPAAVVLSFDGFKPEYFTEDQMPNLYKLKEIAAGPKFMRSVFPTKTFVTHFTLSTGVYPYVHGVHGNTMFNDKDEIIFNTKEQFQSNDKIVPIWIENQKVGNERHSGVMMWPGSEFDYGGITPTYMEKYNPEISWNDRAKKIVEWMSATDKKANLVMAYFEDTQSTIKNEIESQLKAHIKKVDDIIQEIYSGLKDANIQGDLDLIIMSDHGTKQVLGTEVLFVDDYVISEDVQTIISGPLLFVKAKTTEEYAQLYSHLLSHVDYFSTFNIYSSFDLSILWKMNYLPEMDKLILWVVANPGYTFYEREEFNTAKGDLELDQFAVEENGYSNLDESMNAFFLGIGPKFRNNVYLDGCFDLIDVYPLLKTLLDLKEGVNDIQKIVDLDPNVKEILEPSCYETHDQNEVNTN